MDEEPAVVFLSWAFPEVTAGAVKLFATPRLGLIDLSRIDSLDPDKLEFEFAPSPVPLGGVVDCDCPWIAAKVAANPPDPLAFENDCATEAVGNAETLFDPASRVAIIRNGLRLIRQDSP